MGVCLYQAPRRPRWSQPSEVSETTVYAAQTTEDSGHHEKEVVFPLLGGAAPGQGSTGLSLAPETTEDVYTSSHFCTSHHPPLGIYPSGPGCTVFQRVLFIQTTKENKMSYLLTKMTID